MFKHQLDPRDCIVLFADLQQGIVQLSQTISIDHLGKAVNGLAKLARIFDMPIIVSAVAGEDGPPAKIIPQIEEGYGKYAIHHRTTANSFLNEEILGLVEKSRRKIVLISGVAAELAVQLPALVAAELGLRAVLVLVACGGVSVRTEQAALARISQAGSTTTCVLTLAGELGGDFRQPIAQQSIGVVFEMAAS